MGSTRQSSWTRPKHTSCRASLWEWDAAIRTPIYPVIATRPKPISRPRSLLPKLERRSTERLPGQSAPGQAAIPAVPATEKSGLSNPSSPLSCIGSSAADVWTSARPAAAINVSTTAPAKLSTSADVSTPARLSASSAKHVFSLSSGTGAGK